MRNRQRPTKQIKPDAGQDKREVYDHPAFGTIGMSVVTGGDPHLFGSDINHGQRIQITIQRAELHRSLSSDWVHHRGLPIIEVEMSHSQFAEFITTPNRGEGIPCTITQIGADMIPAIEQVETKQQMFRREIHASASKKIDLFRKEVARLGEMLNGGTLSKKELRELHHTLMCHVSNMPSDMAFTVEQAEEALEKATTAAKIEIEATVNHHINRIGLDAARQIGLVQPHHQLKEIEK